MAPPRLASERPRRGLATNLLLRARMAILQAILALVSRSLGRMLSTREAA